eukprot:5362547-Lingulodinium_polyedra.AAC.1
MERGACGRRYRWGQEAWKGFCRAALAATLADVVGVLECGEQNWGTRRVRRVCSAAMSYAAAAATSPPFSTRAVR